MKKLKWILLFVLLPIIIFAQNNDSTKAVEKYKIICGYIQPGITYQDNSMGTFSEFHKIMPASKLLGENLDSYDLYNEKQRGSFFYSQSIGICKIKENKKTNPEFRIGFMYFARPLIYSNYSTKRQGGKDTIVSSGNSNDTSYYDTVYHKYYLLELKSQQLRLDASVLLRTNPDAKHSMFGGIGIEIGGAFNTYADVVYMASTQINVNSTIPNYTGNYNLGLEHETEKVKLKNAFAAAIYLPLGCDLILFNSRFHFIGELRPYLNMSTIPELSKTITNAGIRTSMGIKVNF